MTDFHLGQSVTYKDFTGYINFISDEYITICIREYTPPAEETKHSKQQQRQVCLCVFPNDWNYVTQTQKQVTNKFSTENAEIVENIK